MQIEPSDTLPLRWLYCSLPLLPVGSATRCSCYPLPDRDTRCLYYSQLSHAAPGTVVLCYLLLQLRDMHLLWFLASHCCRIQVPTVIVAAMMSYAATGCSRACRERAQLSYCAVDRWVALLPTADVPR